MKGILNMIQKIITYYETLLLQTPLENYFFRHITLNTSKILSKPQPNLNLTLTKQLGFT